MGIRAFFEQMAWVAPPSLVVSGSDPGQPGIPARWRPIAGRMSGRKHRRPVA